MGVFICMRPLHFLGRQLGPLARSSFHLQQRPKRPRQGPIAAPLKVAGATAPGPGSRSMRLSTANRSPPPHLQAALYPLSAALGVCAVASGFPMQRFRLDPATASRTDDHQFAFRMRAGPGREDPLKSSCSLETRQLDHHKRASVDLPDR